MSQAPTTEDYRRFKRAMAFAAGAAYVDTQVWDAVMAETLCSSLAQLEADDAIAMFSLGMFVAFINDERGLAARVHEQVDDLFPWSKPPEEVNDGYE